MAAPAGATGLCDPEGHFCMQLDTTSASVCDLLRVGGLDPDTCSVQDAVRREVLRRSPLPQIRAFTVRFEDFWVLVAVGRTPVTGEVSEADLPEQATRAREAMERIGGAAVEQRAPPVIERIHDVQDIRFDWRFTLEGAALEEIAEEVRSRDATYAVTFQGPEGARLRAFAQASLATIDTLPARSVNGAGEAMTWLVRGAFLAVVLAAGGVWLSRRKGRGGMDARDLWPR